MNLSTRQRIVISVVVFSLFCILSSHRTIQENSREYRAHPSAALIGAATPNLAIAIGFYWLLGIQRKKPRWHFPLSKAKFTENDKQNDWAFELAANELDSGVMNKSIWARATSECNGEESATKARYISLRVERLVSDKILDEQNNIDVKAESSASIRARRNFNYLLVTSTIAGVIALIYLVNRNNTPVDENANVSQKAAVIENVPVKQIYIPSRPYEVRGDGQYSKSTGLQEQKTSRDAKATSRDKKHSLTPQEWKEQMDKKESDVLRLILEGMTKKEVASLVGQPRAIDEDWSKQGDDYEQDRWNYGSVWVYFEHGLVAFNPAK